jgi:hypothetical protein
MIRRWIGIALLAGSWLLGSGYFHAPHWLAWAIVVIAGFTCLMGSLNRFAPTAPWAVALMLLPAIWLAPWSYRLAPLAIAIGAAASNVPVMRRWLRPASSALLLGGVVLMAQALALLAYAMATARSHQLPEPLPQIIAFFSRIVGIDAGTDGVNVTMGAMRQSHSMGATWELLLDVPTLCFLVGGAVMLAMLAQANLPRGKRGRYWLAATRTLFLCVVAWLPVRVMLMLSVYMHRVLRTDYDAAYSVMNQFWNEWVNVLLLAPPVLLAAKFVRPPRADADTTGSPVPPLWIRAAAALGAFAAVGLVTASLVWEPAGARKGGRVLIDEFHSTWEPTDKPYNTDAYGHLAAYNYAVLYDYCSRFFEMGRLTTAIDDQALRDCDVLIAKIPTSRYQPHEVAAIARFVKRGGGLMLVGEHTDVWGSGTDLNDIAERFGFRFRMDCLFGLDSTFEEHFDPPTVPHPIIANMGPLDFAVSCSIAPGASSGRAVIWNTGLRSAPADYHASNFYPQVLDFPESRYGAFVQLWATQQGPGRVVAFTDSTIFSNFCFFDPGKSQLFLGMTEWLNREGTADLSMWLAIAGLLAGAATLIAARRWSGGWIVLLAAGALGWAVMAGSARAYAIAQPLPPAKRPLTKVVIDRTTSDVILPKGGFIAGKEDGFGIFERWILRVGYFFQRREGKGVFDDDMAVFIYPSKAVSDDFRQQLLHYVERGGHALVLDSPENRRSTTDALLEPFGVSLGGKVSGGDLSIAPGWPKIAVTTAREVLGAASIITLNGKSVAGSVKRGKGSLTVIGFGSRFCDSDMGITGDQPPDANMRAVYELEFSLLRSIAEGRALSPPPTTAPTTAPAITADKDEKPVSP